MDIKDFFAQVTLTASQGEALGRLEEFFESDVPCFLLKGYAGTGKTFLLKGLVEYLKAGKRQVVLTAPTGRAAQVLTEKTGFEATTIHRMLYAGETLHDIAETGGKEYDIYKIFFGTSENDDPANAVYISDEASMISNIYAENDQMKFGSGFLMNDLVTYIWPDPANSKRKLIFVGDTAQLPPVDMNISPALDATYLKEKFGLESLEHELTEVVRQKGASGILQNATMLRRKIAENRFGSLRLEFGSDVRGMKVTDVVSQYLEMAGSEKEDAIVVAYSNHSVYNYNLAIRQQLYPGVKNPVPGDRLVVVRNNYLHGRELLNGEIGTLVSVNNERTHSHQVVVRLPRNLNNDDAEYKVTLRFRETVIRFVDGSGEYDVESMILDNVLFSGRRDLSYLESVALLVDFKNRWGVKQKTGKTDFRTEMRIDPFFNAVRVKFGYALTCHKAQGGEWKNVFVNCTTGQGYNNEYYFRWLYTAISRAREKLLLINSPSFNQTRLMREAGEDNIESMADAHKKETGDSENTRTDSAGGQPPFHENLANQLCGAAQEAGYRVDGLKHLSYGIQFTLSNAEGSALIRVYYSAKQRVTSIEGLNGEGTAGPGMLDVFGFLNLPFDKKKFNTGPENTGRTDDQKPDALDFLNRLRQTIENTVYPEGISISKVESYPYHEIYFFEEGLKQAVIKFHYNKKQQITRYEIIKPRSNGLEDVLIPLLKNMDL